MRQAQIISNIGLIVRIEGQLKGYQIDNYNSTYNFFVEKYFANKIPSHQTPEIASTLTISNVVLYPISKGFQIVKTYAEFINFRGAAVPITPTYEQYIFDNGNVKFMCSGNDFITELESGYYELVIGLSDGSFLESDIINVCSGNTEVSDFNWITKLGAKVSTKKGIPTTYKH